MAKKKVTPPQKGLYPPYQVENVGVIICSLAPGCLKMALIPLGSFSANQSQVFLKLE